MKSAVQSVLTAGVAVVGASAIAIAPSVQPLPPQQSAVQLAASSQVLQQEFDPIAEVTAWLGGIVIPSGLGTPPPSPVAPPPVPTPGTLASDIETTYNFIEYWVEYGFELGAWAFSWVPWIGWLAPQIWPIGYNLFERMVRSGVFNFTDWLEGQGGVVDNLVDFGVDVVNSFIQWGIDQWNFWIGWLPIPPLPGILSGVEETNPVTAVTGLAVQTPLKAGATLHAAAAAATDVLGNTIERLTGILTGKGVEPTAVTLTGDPVVDPVTLTGDPVVDPATLTGDPVVDPATLTGDPVVDPVTLTPKRDARDLRRANVLKAAVAARTVAGGVVPARGEIRGGVTTLVKHISQAARSDKRGALRQAVADVRSAVADGVTKGVKKADDGTAAKATARSDKHGALRQAVADVRSAVADGVTKGVKKADDGTAAKATKANSEN